MLLRRYVSLHVYAKEFFAAADIDSTKWNSALLLFKNGLRDTASHQARYYKGVGFMGEKLQRFVEGSRDNAIAALSGAMAGALVIALYESPHNKGLAISLAVFAVCSCVSAIIGLTKSGKTPNTVSLAILLISAAAAGYTVWDSIQQRPQSFATIESNGVAYKISAQDCDFGVKGVMTCKIREE